MEIELHIADYIVMGLFVLISVGIGVYYGVFKQQKTTEEYLLGNRKMHLLPVALSLLVTYQSAISVMGVPVEMYYYNTMGIYVFVGICLSNIVQGFLIVPLLHPLRLTSAYEYLGRRYQSRSVQLLGTFIGMLQTVLYMAVVLYAPALALESVAKIPLWVSVIAVGVVGTVYTSIGGIKSVIWTDVFQFICLYGGLTSILVIGILRIGGFGRVIEENNAGNRIQFDDARIDPRVRHSLWSCIIGGLFMWLPNCCNQSAVQRICSMRTLKEARTSVLLNVPLGLSYGAVLLCVGLLVYAYFRIAECDPLAAGYIDNTNQLVPYFVMHVLNDVPGLAGIFVAALFSGALSSLSSGINSMAANTIQDIIVNFIEDTSQVKKTLIAKLLVFVYGIVTVILAYFAKALPGPVTQMALTVMGATGGPVVGIIFLGATFPQANWIGAFIGGIIAIVFNIWLAVSSLLFGNKTPKLPLNPTSGCSVNGTAFFNTSLTHSEYSSTYQFMETTLSPLGLTSTLTDTTASIEGSSFHIPLFDISYTYLGLVGFLIAFTIGISVSLVTGMNRDYPTEPEYIFPCLRGFWRAGYRDLNSPAKYRVTKTSKDSSSTCGSPVPTRIRSLDLSWYKNAKDDEL